VVVEEEQLQELLLLPQELEKKVREKKEMRKNMKKNPRKELTNLLIRNYLTKKT